MADSTLPQYARFFQARAATLDDFRGEIVRINATLHQQISLDGAIASATRLSALYAQLIFSLHQIEDFAHREEQIIMPSYRL